MMNEFKETKELGQEGINQMNIMNENFQSNFSGLKTTMRTITIQ
jgi:hypothetical protein